MERIAVTGGSGKLGRAVVADLVAHGYHVINLDQRPPDDPPAGESSFVQVDLTDYGQAVEALSAIDDRYERIDAVAHLAAIPAPGLTTNVTLFDRNLTSTHHVFAAARAVGIKRVVWASSETVLGLPFDTPPPYLPVDEEYPPRPESSYSLAKRLEEAMAEQFCRWDPLLRMTGLRFSNVMEPADYADFSSHHGDFGARRWNLWGYIDARDGAQAVRLALQTDRPGLELFIIAAADTVMDTPSAALAAAEFPDVELRRDLEGFETLLGIEKARRLLGYHPVHSWRDHG